LYLQCFVGSAGAGDEIFPNAGPACFGYRSSVQPAAPVLATGGQCRWRIATVGKSDPRRRAPCPVCQRSENTTFPRECHRAPAGLTSFLCLLSIGRAKKVGRLPAGTGELDFPVLVWIVSKVKGKTAGRVPLTPYFLSKRPQKVSKKGLSPAEGMAFARGGGFYRHDYSLHGSVFDPPNGQGPS